MFRHFLLCLLLLSPLCLRPSLGEQATNLAQSTATDPNYVLIAGDTLSFVVLDETDMAATLLVDKDGQIRPPLLQDLVVAGQSIRSIESSLEKAYVQQELLKRPQVRLNVLNYAPRIVTILGSVRSPGKVSFGRDANTIDIVDAITQAGGFTPAAKKRQVSVIRTNPNGHEEKFTVDVDAMMSGKRSADTPREFALRPGDKVIVDDKVF